MASFSLKKRKDDLGKKSSHETRVEDFFFSFFRFSFLSRVFFSFLFFSVSYLSVLRMLFFAFSLFLCLGNTRKFNYKY